MGGAAGQASGNGEQFVDWPHAVARYAPPAECRSKFKVTRAALSGRMRADDHSFVY